jgi:hypothetical protein
MLRIREPIGSPPDDPADFPGITGQGQAFDLASRRLKAEGLGRPDYQYVSPDGSAAST